MKKIQVLGSGCAKCNKLYDLSEKAANELAVDYSIEKIADIKKIMEYDVMITPALVIDGEVKVSGKIPSLDELKKLLC